MPKQKRTAVSPALREAVLLLRYHKKRPVKTDATYMSYASIAASLDLPYHKVRYICTRVYLQKKRKSKVRAAARTLEAA